MSSVRAVIGPTVLSLPPKLSHFPYHYQIINKYRCVVDCLFGGHMSVVHSEIRSFGGSLSTLFV